MRRLLRSLLALIAAALVALVLGTVLPRPLFDPASGSEPPTRRILVLSSQIHTDIAVPIDALTLADFAFLRDAGLPVDHPDARWILFGWGGRAFYLQTPTWGDLKPLPVFKALTIDASVMHVEILGAIAEPWPGLLDFDIPESKYRDMLAFIRASFTESGGAPAPHRRRALRQDRRLLRGHRLLQRAARLQHLDGRGAETSRPPDRLVEPAARHARLFAGAAQLRALRSSFVIPDAERSEAIRNPLAA